MENKDILKKLKELNVPWITEEDHLDLTKYPIDSTLEQALGNDEEVFRSACRMLGSMAGSGRKEAGVFLYGLLQHFDGNLRRKQEVVEALYEVRTSQTARLLFEELERTESSNTTRVYLNAVLKALHGLPLDLIEDRFHKLLSDPKWTHRMKQKFKEILNEAEDRATRRAMRSGDPASAPIPTENLPLEVGNSPISLEPKIHLSEE